MKLLESLGFENSADIFKTGIEKLAQRLKKGQAYQKV